VLLARVPNAHVLTCGSCGICRTAAKHASAALEERAQDRLQAKGRVDFALFNIPASKILMPVDNEPKHGGVAEPRRIMAKTFDRMKN
jgi:hypothetical protein